MPKNRGRYSLPSVFTDPEQFRLSVVNYKGKSFNWKPPATLGQFVRSARTLLRFWDRLMKGNICYTPLVSSCQRLSSLYLDFVSRNAGLYLSEILTSNLIQNLESVAFWVPPATHQGTFSAKVRKHIKNTFCSVCGVELVWPAQLVTQKTATLEVVSESSPIGIQCLNSHHERLEDMISVIEAPGYFDHLISDLDYSASQKFRTLTARRSVVNNQLEFAGIGAQT